MKIFETYPSEAEKEALLQSLQHAAIKIQPLVMCHLRAFTDKKKKIISFEVNDSRVMYLRFDKF